MAVRIDLLNEVTGETKVVTVTEEGLTFDGLTLTLAHMGMVQRVANYLDSLVNADETVVPDEAGATEGVRDGHGDPDGAGSCGNGSPDRIG